MFALTNVVRDYAWGSKTAIAELLGTPASGGPEAELWMGAHPDSPSVAETSNGPVPLDQLIADHPLVALGQQAYSDFGPKLPFLVKLLAADKALSLQVHPTKEQAQERFAAEESAGVARDAAGRNYRDNNHKPEMILALTPFEALCGFRTCAESAELFRAVAAAIEATGAVVPELIQRTEMALNSRMAEPMVVRRAFETLAAKDEQTAAVVDLAASSLAASSAAGARLSPGLLSVIDLNQQYPGDAGVLISLLLNRVSLQPGEAMYLPAGNIHAYLGGLGLEVMASSDNVLRGGLTGKHIDVPELLDTVDFTPGDAPSLPSRVTELGQEVWEPPFAEFALQRVVVAASSEPVPLVQNGPLIVLAVQGSVLLDSPRGDKILARGESVFVPAVENPVMVHPAAGSGTVTETAAGSGSGSDAEAVVFAITVAARA